MRGIFIIVSLFALCFISCKNKTCTYTGGAIGTTAGKVKNNNSPLIGKSKIVPKDATIGNFLDDQDRKIMNNISTETLEKMDRGEALSINDIIKLSEARINNEKIIFYIKESKTTYNLTQPQINKLKEANVNQKIINFMVQTGK